MLEFIRDEIAAGRGWPTNTLIAEHMGWRNAQSVTDALHGLRGDGHVRLGYVKGRQRWEMVD